jgi:hypothetical protein
MAIAAARRSFRVASASPARHFLFLGQFVAVGLLAIAISGAICLGLRHASGENSIAGDSQSAYLSPARCADLREYYPEAPTCSAAELAHHADEIVLYRLSMAPVAAFVLIAYEVLRRTWRLTPVERGRQRRWHSALGLVAFGVAALVLLSMGFVNVARGEAAGTARWLSDGGASLAFCALYAAYRGSIKTAD